MNEDNTFTFELSDLTYDELIDSVVKVNDFIKFIDEELITMEEENKKED